MDEVVHRKDGESFQALGKGLASLADSIADENLSSTDSTLVIAALKDKVRQLEERMQDRFDEIVALTKIIREQEREISAEMERTDQMCAIAGILTRGWSRRVMSWIAGLTPAVFIRSRQIAEIKKAGLFDADAYLRIYPDVRRSKYTPLRHYLMHGFREQRTLKKEGR